MGKHVRIGLGGLLVIGGIIFFILPGTIFFVMLGLTLLSYDVPAARGWLKKCQNAASVGARQMDKTLMNLRLRRYK